MPAQNPNIIKLLPKQDIYWSPLLEQSICQLVQVYQLTSPSQPWVLSMKHQVKHVLQKGRKSYWTIVRWVKNHRQQHCLTGQFFSSKMFSLAKESQGRPNRGPVAIDMCVSGPLVRLWYFCVFFCCCCFLNPVTFPLTNSLSFNQGSVPWPY